MGKPGKKYTEALKKVDRAKRYDLEDVVKLLMDTAYAKFDEGVDVAFVWEWIQEAGPDGERDSCLPHGTEKR